MPQGYYTIEKWKAASKANAGQWIAITHLPFGTTQTAAEKALETLGKPGFYRLVHMQRVIWAEHDAKSGKLYLRTSHAGSPESLDRMREMFDRCGGKYPLEEVREARRKAKSGRR